MTTDSLLQRRPCCFLIESAEKVPDTVSFPRGVGMTKGSKNGMSEDGNDVNKRSEEHTSELQSH